MRRYSKWGISSGLLAAFLIFSSSWPISAQALNRDDKTRTIKSATLYKRVGDTLFFATNRGGRLWTVRGKLADLTQVFSEKEEEINEKALELGSVWTIKLEYPIQEGELLVILEMKRTQPRTPE